MVAETDGQAGEPEQHLQWAQTVSEKLERLQQAVRSVDGRVTDAGRTAVEARNDVSEVKEYVESDLQGRIDGMREDLGTLAEAVEDLQAAHRSHESDAESELQGAAEAIEALEERLEEIEQRQIDIRSQVTEVRTELTETRRMAREANQRGLLDVLLGR